MSKAKAPTGWPTAELQVTDVDGSVTTRRVTCNVGDSTDAARSNGWVAGTVLVGDGGYGPDAIRVDYVGHRLLIASRFAAYRDGEWLSNSAHESVWSLANRDWRVATEDELKAIEAAE